MSQYKVVSLFSGCGGLDLGIGVLNDIGRERYIKLPKENTNERGVEITSEALMLLEKCEDTRIIDINFIREEIDYREVYTKWIDAWTEEY